MYCFSVNIRDYPKDKNSGNHNKLLLLSIVSLLYTGNNMNRLFTLIILYLLPLTTIAQSDDMIQQHQWKQRVLLIFSPDATDSLYQQQLAEYQQQEAGLKERDLVMYKILDDKVIVPTGKEYDRAVAQALRNQYQIKEKGLTVVLIGKDGGEKLTEQGLLSTDKLFATIDRMPMRQQEMRRQR